MSANIISIRDLHRRFGATEALCGVELEVCGPGVFGFLGVNGAGKTTTLRVLAGLIRPSAGEVRLFGQSLAQGGEALRARIGYLPQEPAFFPWMSGREVLRFTADLFGLERGAARRRADELLARLGLEGAAARRVGGYSGGMVQRLGIAQALVNDPELLLLDEPVSALDPVGRADMLTLLRELGHERTVFMSTHILADVERVAAEVAILDAGRVLAREDTAALRQRYLKPAFSLQVTGDAKGLATRASAAAWVERCELGEVRRGAQTLRVEVRDMDEGRRQLPALMAAAGVGLVRCEEAVPTLEQVFMQLVGHDRGAGEVAS